jgi:hypothetical protein
VAKVEGEVATVETFWDGKRGDVEEELCAGITPQVLNLEP